MRVHGEIYTADGWADWSYEVPSDLADDITAETVSMAVAAGYAPPTQYDWIEAANLFLARGLLVHGHSRFVKSVAR